MAESRVPEEPGQAGESAAALAPEMDDSGSVFLERPPCSVFELSIPARIEAVGPLCAFLNMVGACHGLETADLQCVEISAYETCLNIIEHACCIRRLISHSVFHP